MTNKYTPSNEHYKMEINPNTKLWYSAVQLKIDKLEKYVSEKLKKYPVLPSSTYLDFKEKLLEIEKKIDRYIGENDNRISILQSDFKIISEMKNENETFKSKHRETLNNITFEYAELFSKINILNKKCEKINDEASARVEELNKSLISLKAEADSKYITIGEVQKIIDKKVDEVKSLSSEYMNTNKYEFILETLKKYQGALDMIFEILHSEKVKTTQNTSRIEKIINTDFLRLKINNNENAKRIENLTLTLDKFKNSSDNFATKEQLIEKLNNFREESIIKLNEKINYLEFAKLKNEFSEHILNSKALKAKIDKCVDYNMLETEIMKLKNQSVASENVKNNLVKLFSSITNELEQGLNHISDQWIKTNFKLWNLSYNLNLIRSKMKYKSSKCHECDNKINALFEEIGLMKNLVENKYANSTHSYFSYENYNDVNPKNMSKKSRRRLKYSIVLRIKKSVLTAEPMSKKPEIVKYLQEWPFKMHFDDYVKFYNLEHFWIRDNFEYLSVNDFIHKAKDNDIRMVNLNTKQNNGFGNILYRNFRKGPPERKPNRRHLQSQ